MLGRNFHQSHYEITFVFNFSTIIFGRLSANDNSIFEILKVVKFLFKSKEFSFVSYFTGIWVEIERYTSKISGKGYIHQHMYVLRMKQWFTTTTTILAQYGCVQFVCEDLVANVSTPCLIHCK